MPICLQVFPIPKSEPVRACARGRHSGLQVWLSAAQTLLPDPGVLPEMTQHRWQGLGHLQWIAGRGCPLARPCWEGSPLPPPLAPVALAVPGLETWLLDWGSRDPCSRSRKKPVSCGWGPVPGRSPGRLSRVDRARVFKPGVCNRCNIRAMDMAATGGLAGPFREWLGSGSGPEQREGVWPHYSDVGATRGTMPHTWSCVLWGVCVLLGAG